MSSLRIKKYLYCLVLLAMLGLNACAVIGSNFATLGDLVATKSKRTRSLDTAVGSYYQARYWGGNQETMSYVHRDVRGEISRQLRKEDKGARFVDYEIEDVNMLDEDATKADVTISVRYFRTGSGIMEKRMERQNWKYHRYTGGWMVHSSQIVEFLGATDEMTSEIRGRF